MAQHHPFFVAYPRHDYKRSIDSKAKVALGAL
jgi:hypothetical protein